jgi:hypothetical protein
MRSTLAHERRRTYPFYSPSVNLALPPVGWHSTVAHEPHRTTVCACENTVVMAKHPIVRRMVTSTSSYLTNDGPFALTWAFYVHEVRIWRLHETLELVLSLFVLL